MWAATDDDLDDSVETTTWMMMLATTLTTMEAATAGGGGWCEWWRGLAGSCRDAAARLHAGEPAPDVELPFAQVQNGKFWSGCWQTPQSWTKSARWTWRCSGRDGKSSEATLGGSGSQWFSSRLLALFLGGFKHVSAVNFIAASLQYRRSAIEVDGGDPNALGRPQLSILWARTLKRVKGLGWGWLGVELGDTVGWALAEAHRVLSYLSNHGSSTNSRTAGKVHLGWNVESSRGLPRSKLSPHDRLAKDFQGFSRV